MSQFDNLRDQAEGQLAEHSDQVESVTDQGLDRAADAVDDATGGRFSDQVDEAQQRGDDAIGDGGADSGDSESSYEDSGSEDSEDS